MSPTLLHSQELKDCSRGSAVGTGITLVPNEQNLYVWKALLQGPSGTAYEGGLFELTLTVPQQYPLMPPQVRCRCMQAVLTMLMWRRGAAVNGESLQLMCRWRVQAWHACKPWPSALLASLAVLCAIVCL